LGLYRAYGARQPPADRGWPTCEAHPAEAMNKTKLLASAQTHMRKGQYRKAIAAFERVLKEDPDDVRARLNLANLYYRREDFPRAVETFLDVAKIYEDSGATLKAIAVYKQAIKLDRDRADLHVLIADNYERHGLLNEAGKSYQHALRLLGTRGDKAGKLDVIRRILELDPANLPDRVRLAEAYSGLGQLNEAVRQFRRVALELDRLGHVKAFQRIGERLLYHQPDDAIIAKKLATSYVVAREPGRALPKLKIAFKHTPRDLEVLGTLVDAFTMLGQAHKAVTVLKEMARQYEKSGLLHERDDCFREILTMDPDDDSAVERVRPTESAHEGETIEFDPHGSAPQKSPAAPPLPDSVDSGPPPLPPPLPSKPRSKQHREVGQKTSTMSEGAKVRARRGSLDLDEQSTPRKPATTGDRVAAAAIEQLVQESVEARDAGPPSRAETRAPRPVSEATAGDLEALFAAAIDEVSSPGAHEQPTPESISEAEVYARGAALDDDGPGFDGGIEESTQVDVEPPDADPAVTKPIVEDPAAGLADGLEELDFYLNRTLIAEAQSLLDTLQERYHSHPELTRRAESLARLT
jgi:tetratricopeptide (TPR) repeat protein